MRRRKIVIEVVDNGFLVTDNEDEEFPTSTVFETDDHSTHCYDPALEGLLGHLCYEALSEHNGSKFGEKRLSINVEEGSHYEKPDGNVRLSA